MEVLCDWMVDSFIYWGSIIAYGWLIQKGVNLAAPLVMAFIGKCRTFIALYRGGGKSC